MSQAETADIEGVSIRVVRADYLAVIALSVGRTKDFLRIISLLESESISKNMISVLAEKHGLSDAWVSFKKRYLDEE